MIFQINIAIGIVFYTGHFHLITIGNHSTMCYFQ